MSEKRLKVAKEEPGVGVGRSSQNNSSVETEADDLLMIRAVYHNSYNEDVMKFQYCISSGIGKLYEEVAKRLRMKIEKLKLKHVDAYGDKILIACDDDLKLLVKKVAPSGNSYVDLFVEWKY